VFFQAFDLLSS